MIDLARSEFFKLRTVRLNVVLPLVGVAFVVVVIALVGVFTNLDDTTTTSGDLATIVGVASVLAGLLISVIGVLSISSEFAHGTIRPTLAATPNRTEVFGVKALVLLVVAAIVGLVTAIGSYLVGYAILTARGAEDLTLFASDGTCAVMIGIPLLFMMLTMFGFGLGLLVRSSPAAVAVAILWPILIENVIAIPLALSGVDEPIRYLPYQSALALTSADTDGFPNGRVGGGLYFGLVVIVLVAVAIFVNRRRDV